MENPPRVVDRLRAPLESLPLDIFDRLLYTLSSLDDLQAAVLSARQFYEAYAPRSKVILTSVVHNELGPTVCHARALYRAALETNTEPYVEIGDECFLTPEDHLVDFISVKEARELVRYKGVALRLETYFSIL